MCSNENGAFQATVGGQLCVPGVSYAVGTTDNGKHQFGVEAVDLAGNVSGSVSYSWKVAKGALATPTLTTSLSAGSIMVGTSAYDTATLSGATQNAGGTLTYTAYSTNSCTTGAKAAGKVTVKNGVVPHSDPVTFTAAGSYWWRAVYSGDSSNAGASSLCVSEPLIVNKKPAALSTAASGPVTVGSSVTDVATLTGPYGTPAAAKMTFNVYAAGDGSCGTPLNGATPIPAVSSNSGANPTYTSGPYTPANAGTYKWVATFAGDTNNANATGGCGASGESATVNQAQPTIATTLSAASIPIGGTAYDSSALSGFVNLVAGGTVAYSYYTNDTCTTAVQSVNTVTVATDGSVPVSSTVMFNSPGVFYWRAVYSGDTNNVAAASPCTAADNEQLIVSPSYTISGIVPSPLYPGAAAQSIPVDFDSTNNGNGGNGANGTQVSNLTVSIGSITGGGPGPNPCTATDFQITQIPAGAYPFYVPFGVSTLASIIGAANLPKIRMIDRQDTHPGDGSGNQDTCKGATVHLSYTGTP